MNLSLISYCPAPAMAQQMFAAKYYFDYGEFNGRPVKINCLTALAYCVILGSIAYFVPLTGSDLMQWADAAGQGLPGSILFASMALLFSMLSFHVVVIVVLGWMLTNPPGYLQGKFPAVSHNRVHVPSLSLNL